MIDYRDIRDCYITRDYRQIEIILIWEDEDGLDRDYSCRLKAH